MADETTGTAVADEETPQVDAPVDPTIDAGAHDEPHHPRPSTYVWIALILSIVTAVEVALYYVDDVSDTTITISLLVLMVIKFFLVASWYMHLRFEARIFKQLFYGGLFLAVAVYAVVLGASHVFPILV